MYYTLHEGSTPNGKGKHTDKKGEKKKNYAYCINAEANG